MFAAGTYHLKDRACVSSGKFQRVIAPEFETAGKNIVNFWPGFSIDHNEFLPALRKGTGEPFAIRTEQDGTGYDAIGRQVLLTVQYQHWLAALYSRVCESVACRAEHKVSNTLKWWA